MRRVIELHGIDWQYGIGVMVGWKLGSRLSLRPFDIAREGSKVGVGEDVGVQAQNVGCICLERLLSNCPASHNKVYWWNTGKGDREAKNSMYASSARGACPAVVSRARCSLNVTMCEGRSSSAVIFFFRGRHKESTSAPVIVPWRAAIALIMSRGNRCKVSVSGSEIARRFDSPILFRIAGQKEAEHASQVDLASVARWKASRAAGPGKSGLTRNAPPRCVCVC